MPEWHQALLAASISDHASRTHVTSSSVGIDTALTTRCRHTCAREAMWAGESPLEARAPTQTAPALALTPAAPPAQVAHSSSTTRPSTGRAAAPRRH
eukprot:scaffold16321_cov39-Phaeocystis_antarctica.AAC.1